MIDLPTELRDALDDALTPYSSRELATAAADLSAGYRRDVTSAARQLGAPSTRGASHSTRPARATARRADDAEATDTTGVGETDTPFATAPNPRGTAPMTALAVAAYAATRLPATFAACAAALTQARLRRPNWRPRTLLDVGAGTGAALWAARTVWPDLAHAVLIERDRQMLALGKRLVDAMPNVTTVEWRQADARDPALWEADASATDAANNSQGARRNKAANLHVTSGGYDLVTAAYALSELRADEREALVARLWGATGGALALIGPGTPIGFAHIRAARAQLIEAGAIILAPCPDDGVCPMGAAWPLAATGARHDGARANTDVPLSTTTTMTANGGRRENSEAGARQPIPAPGHFIAPDDWCHFAARLARSRLHRQIKGGDLAYEDEKYSYVIAVRPSNLSIAPTAPIGGRVVRHPQTRPGLVALEVCAPGGLERRVITRKDRDAYRQARDLRWGDAISQA